MTRRSNITVVTHRGQVSIPAHIRRELKLDTGRKLIWERVSAHEIRVTVLDDSRPVGAKAVLGFARRFRPKPRTTDDWMAELREGEQ